LLQINILISEEQTGQARIEHKSSFLLHLDHHLKPYFLNNI